MVVALSANAASQTRRGVSHGEADGKDRGDGQAPIKKCVWQRLEAPLRIDIWDITY
jgi:hypothetical protein